MIRSLSANKSFFQRIEFGLGLNVLLAERDPDATSQHSRNARGKTTVVQAINFCLAGNLPASMAALADDDWIFELEFDLAGATVRASRSTARPGTVELDFVSTPPGLVRPFLQGGKSVSLNDWKLILALGLFGLDADSATAGGISARSLLSYLIRTASVADPLKFLPQQSAVSSRANIAYFLGLDFAVASELQRIKKADDALKGLMYAVDKHLVDELESEDELLLRVGESSRRLAELERLLRDFRVVDDRDSLVFRADQLTNDLAELRNASLLDRRLVAMYRQSIDRDEVGEYRPRDVEDIFEAVGRTFSEGVHRSLESVQEFHQAVVRNRREYLERELTAIEARERDRTARMTELDGERSRLMRILESSGALEELLALQQEASTVRGDLLVAESRLRTLRDGRQKRAELRLERAELRTRATRDVAQAQQRLDDLSSLFSSLLNELYGRGGVVSADVDDYGPRFKVTVDSGAASSGVSRMTLLCFDLALMLSSAPAARHPGWLVHDSSIFEGVDSRQVTAALKLAASRATSANLQYICTLNSDTIVPEARDEAWFQDRVVREVLDTELGGFLGVVF